jgi:hypothetical protein
MICRGADKRAILRDVFHGHFFLFQIKIVLGDVASSDDSSQSRMDKMAIPMEKLILRRWTLDLKDGETTMRLTYAIRKQFILPVFPRQPAR